MTIGRKAYEWLGDTFGWRNGQFVRLFEAPMTDAGISVSPRTALQTIAVQRCATLISGAALSLPVELYRRRGGKRVAIDSHPVDTIFNRTANPEMSAAAARGFGWMSFLLWGNAYYRKVVSDDGRLIALWPLQPDQMRIARNTDTGKLVYVYSVNGKEFPYSQDEIFHVPSYSLDGIVGMSIVELHRQSIGANQAGEKFGAKYFSNGARPSMVLEYPAKLSNDAIKNLRESFEATYGGIDNAHRVAVLEQGAKLNAVSINPKDSQFLEQQQYSDEKIAMMFGVPPHMIGLVSKTTSWGTGIGEQKQGFMTFTLLPQLKLWEAAIQFSLLSNEPNVTARHNVDEFLRADILTRYQAHAIAVEKGILSRNEVRGVEDYDPYPGGDVYTVQQQMIDINQMGKVPAVGGGPNAAPGN